jgi:hypothetical protein
MNLYEIASHYRALSAKIEDNDGELTPEIREALDEMGDGIDRKADSIRQLIAELRMHEVGLKAEAEEWLVRLARKRREIEGWKSYLLSALERAGLDRAGRTHQVVICRNSSPEDIRWVGEGEFPEEYLRITTTAVKDRAKLLELYRQGRLPEGFLPEPHGKHLRFR